MDFTMARFLKGAGLSMATVVDVVFNTLFRRKYGRLPLIFLEDFNNGEDEDLKTRAAEIAWKL